MSLAKSFLEKNIFFKCLQFWCFLQKNGEKKSLKSLFLNHDIKDNISENKEMVLKGN